MSQPHCADASQPASAFDRDTAVTRNGAERFEAEIQPSWWVVRGPNGGYVAAILLRALQERLADPSRTPRSLTVHYASPCEPGPARVITRVERLGRSVALLAASLTQGERLRASAMAAFSPAWEGVEYSALQMPGLPDPISLPSLSQRIAADGGRPPPFFAHWEHRPGFGEPPFSGAESSRAGGWLRLAERRPFDALRLAAASDCWPPSVLSRVTQPILSSTIDLTIHFRASKPRLAADDYIAAVFRSSHAGEGFFEEDGELWAPDGTLLAQSRQLALAAYRK